MCHNVQPSRAALQTSDGIFTKVRITNPRIRNWVPGSHVLLSIPRYGIGQSHPATILSTPTSHNGDLLFMLRARGGFTKRLASSAKASETVFEHLPGTEKVTSEDTFLCVVDGPYGGCQADLASYETVLLLAASSGITFALSILLDLAGRVQTQKLPVRNLVMLWSVNDVSHTKYVSGELEAAFGRLQRAGIEIQLKLFITCKNNFSSSTSSPAEPAYRQFEAAASQECRLPSEPQQYEDIPINGAHIRHGSASETTLDNSFNCATAEVGRPDIQKILAELSDKAKGEMGVAVCGPLSMNAATRRAVAKLQSHKWDKPSIYLHVEGFSW
jgi:ferric-chelate reductase